MSMSRLSQMQPSLALLLVVAQQQWEDILSLQMA